MSQADVFALQNSRYNTFLFAEVGTDSNGLGLTILSMLARLGKDPWAEAALWAEQPTSVAIDALASSMGSMPLTPASLDSAHAIASRVIKLLPMRSNRNAERSSSEARGLVVSNSGWIVLAYCLLYLSMYMGMAPVPQPGSAVATPAIATTAAAQRHAG